MNIVHLARAIVAAAGALLLGVWVGSFPLNPILSKGGVSPIYERLQWSLAHSVGVADFVASVVVQDVKRERARPHGFRYVPVVLEVSALHEGDSVDIGGFVTLQEISESSDQRAVGHGLLVPLDELRVGLTGVGLFSRLDWRERDAAEPPWLAYVLDTAQAKTRATGRTYLPAFTTAFFRASDGQVTDFGSGESRDTMTTLLGDLAAISADQQQ